MELDFAYALVGIISVIGGAGGAWGATRAQQKDLVRRVDQIDQDLYLHDERTRTVSERLARMEATLTSIDKRIERMGH